MIDPPDANAEARDHANDRVDRFVGRHLGLSRRRRTRDDHDEARRPQLGCEAPADWIVARRLDAHARGRRRRPADPRERQRACDAHDSNLARAFHRLSVPLAKASWGPPGNALR